jgi:hypothetical protein
VVRRIALVVLALSGEAGAEAEHYEQVRVDGGLIGSSAAVDDRNGAGFVSEIKVNVHDLVAVGARVEIAVHFGGHVDDEELPFGMAAAGLVKGEYFVDTGTVRPFAGLGAGVYSMGSHTITDQGVSTTTGRYVGVAPQVGLDLGPVRLAATYHAILGTSVEYRQTSGGIEHRESFSPSYLSLELSFRFGGGRRPPR